MNNNVTKIVVDGEEVILDRKDLTFNELNLNEYLQRYPSIYAYIAEKHAISQHIHSTLSDCYDIILKGKIVFYKQQGCTDKQAEAQALIDNECVEAAAAVREAKKNVNLLAGHLKSLEAADRNSKEFGYNLRKEMGMISKPYIKKLDSDNPEEELNKILH